MPGLRLRLARVIASGLFYRDIYMGLCRPIDCHFDRVLFLQLNCPGERFNSLVNFSRRNDCSAIDLDFRARHPVASVAVSVHDLELIGWRGSLVHVDMSGPGGRAPFVFCLIIRGLGQVWLVFFKIQQRLGRNVI